ncbi:MAG: hypothetical protein IJR14_09405 [Synergistaceae bacterium]|nr:hypothetical protein [Synergistaceae bacterium]
MSDKGYRFTEACLYRHKADKARLTACLDALALAESGSSAHAQNYDAPAKHTGSPSSPVEARFMTIEALRAEIQRLAPIVEGVTRLVNDLAAPCVLPGSDLARLHDVLHLVYFGGGKINVVAETMDVSEPTIRRWKKRLVDIAGHYLGAAHLC